jgi:hypothetical protein
MTALESLSIVALSAALGWVVARVVVWKRERAAIDAAGGVTK